MIKYKFAFSVLSFICSVSFSVLVPAEERQCTFDMSQSKLKVADCSREGNVNILKLAPRDQPSYETDLEGLPTFIVAGKDLDAILKVVGNGASLPYNNLIKLPYPNAILSYSDAPTVAKLKMTQDNWKLISMKDVAYEGQGGNEGAGVVCSTLEREINEGYVVVSQCNSFFEGDIFALKGLLSSIDGQKK